MPIIEAIKASNRSEPSVDESKLPEWAKEVIARAHRPPQVDLSKVYPDTTKSDQGEAPVELAKKDKVLVSLTEIELSNIAEAIVAASSSDDPATEIELQRVNLSGN